MVIFIPVFELFALREQKSSCFTSFPGQIFSAVDSSSSSSSRVSITPDRNGFKERQLYQSLKNILEGHLQVSDI